jgi:hypothetical protein
MKRLIVLAVVIVVAFAQNTVVSADDTKMDFANWMKTLYQNDPTTKLKDIVIPGTHDSGTTYMEQETTFTKTQGLPILEQLQSGIRYLDIRVGLDKKGNMIVVHNNYNSNKMIIDGNDSLLANVKQFLRESPKEILILDFQYFRSVPDDVQKKLLDALAALPLGHTNQAKDKIISKIMENGLRVFVLFTGLDTLRKKHPDWPIPPQIANRTEDTIQPSKGGSEDCLNSWAQKKDPNGLWTFLEEECPEKLPQSAFSVMQGVLTPKIGDFRTTLVRLARISSAEAIFKLMRNEFHHKWNIVIVDYFMKSFSGLTDALVAYNMYKKAPPANYYMAWPDSKGYIYLNTCTFEFFGGKQKQEKINKTSDTPAICATKDRIYIAYRKGSKDLMLATFKGDGSLLSNVRVEDENRKHNCNGGPSLCIGPGGDIVIAFTGRDKQLNIITTKDGKSFTKAIELGKKSKTGPCCIIKDGKIYISWFDNESVNYLNVARFNGKSLVEHATCKMATSEHSPTMAIYNHTLYVAYRGEDEGTAPNLHLLSYDPNNQKFSQITTKPDYRSYSAPAMCSINGKINLYFINQDSSREEDNQLCKITFENESEFVSHVPLMMLEYNEHYHNVGLTAVQQR